MSRPLKIATRPSMLAMAQSRQVASAITDRTGVACELVPIVTRGDRTAGPLAPVGGKGLFTAELEAALRSGEVDLAVHSAKDMPAKLDDDLAIVAVPRRADARDALVCAGPAGLAALPADCLVGTSSPRRSAQLRSLRPDVTIVPLRGNIETRLRRGLGLDAQQSLSAAVVAMAGLVRSGLIEQHLSHVSALEVVDMIPAAGQGALAAAALAGRADLAELLQAVNHAPSHEALLAERHVVSELGAGCHSCLAVYVWPGEARGQWLAVAMAARPDGSGMIRAAADASCAMRAGQALLEQLDSQGARNLLRQGEA